MARGLLRGVQKRCCVQLVLLRRPARSLQGSLRQQWSGITARQVYVSIFTRKVYICDDATSGIGVAPAAALKVVGLSEGEQFVRRAASDRGVVMCQKVFCHTAAVRTYVAVPCISYIARFRLATPH